MKKLCAVFAVLLLLVAACGKKEVKPVSADSRLATEAFALTEQVRTAYVNRNMSALQGYTTADGYQAISSSMKNFDSVQLEFKPMLVDMRDGVVNLYVSWNGTWTWRGQKYEERGLAAFVLKGTPLKLDNVLRASPFRYPEQ